MRSPNLGDCFALPSLREFSKHIVRTFMMQHYSEAYMIRNYCCLFLPYVRKSSWKWPSVLHQAFQTRGQPRQVYSLTVTLPRDTTQRSHSQISNLGKQCETKNFQLLLESICLGRICNTRIESLLPYISTCSRSTLLFFYRLTRYIQLGTFVSETKL